MSPVSCHLIPSDFYIISSFTCLCSKVLIFLDIERLGHHEGIIGNPVKYEDPPTSEPGGPNGGFVTPGQGNGQHHHMMPGPTYQGQQPLHNSFASGHNPYHGGSAPGTVGNGYPGGTNGSLPQGDGGSGPYWAGGAGPPPYQPGHNNAYGGVGPVSTAYGAGGGAAQTYGGGGPGPVYGGGGPAPRAAGPVPPPHYGGGGGAVPPPHYGGGGGAVARNDGPARILPIKSLNPFSGRWTIKVGVCYKEIGHRLLPDRLRV